MTVPMATGAASVVWPLPDVTRKRWTFGASRANGKRHHAGVDLYAPRGSIVLSPEDGTVIASQRFNGPYAYALLIQLDSGPVVLLGEVEPDSWRMFNADPGARVARGQPVARVGINPGGSQMLHYEMYTSGTRQNKRWYSEQAPPPELLDPTNYLQSASALDGDQADDPGDDVIDPGDDEETDDDSVDDDVHDPGLPQIHPEDPAATERARPALVGIAIVALLARLVGKR